MIAHWFDRAYAMYTMQSLDDENKRDLLGEVLHDELRIIMEYVKDLPAIKHRLVKVEDGIGNVHDRLITLEAITRDHENGLKALADRLAGS